jgi:hypothetical protein
VAAMMEGSHWAERNFRMGALKITGVHVRGRNCHAHHHCTVIHMRLPIDVCQGGQELVREAIDWAHRPTAVRLERAEQVAGSSAVGTIVVAVFELTPSGVLARIAVPQSAGLQCGTKVR